jgi:type IV secretory pathway TraG/TraD family ATPase VirD4
MHYNPFAYIRSEKDILKLVNTIIVNTKGDGDKSGEDFWVKAEKLYYTALIGYIWYEGTEHEKNFTTLLEMINASEAREDDETSKIRLTSCSMSWKPETRPLCGEAIPQIQAGGWQNRQVDPD